MGSRMQPWSTLVDSSASLQRNKFRSRPRVLLTWGKDDPFKVDDRDISGDKIVARATMTATHSRVVQGFAPTGRHVAFGTIDKSSSASVNDASNKWSSTSCRTRQARGPSNAS